MCVCLPPHWCEMDMSGGCEAGSTRRWEMWGVVTLSLNSSVEPPHTPGLCSSETNSDHITELETRIIGGKTTTTKIAGGTHVQISPLCMSHISSDAQFSNIRLISSLTVQPVPAQVVSLLSGRLIKPTSLPFTVITFTTSVTPAWAYLLWPIS